jgi:hypothetical protein
MTPSLIRQYNFDNFEGAVSWRYLTQESTAIAAKSKKNLAPVIVEAFPDESILIQIKEKKRDSSGLLTFRRSKSITVHNLRLEEVHFRFLAALKS